MASASIRLMANLLPYSNVIFERTAAPARGDFSEMLILGPHPKDPHQKLWRWGPAICAVTSPPGDPDAGGGLGTTASENVLLSSFLVCVL